MAEKGDWRSVDADLGWPTVYYHRDETPPALQDFLRQQRLSLPLVLLQKKDGDFQVAVTAENLKSCAGEPECLRNKLQEALQAFS